MQHATHAERTLVVSLPSSSGFFSCFNCVINHLHHSLGRRGVAAIQVDWQPRAKPGHFPYGVAGDGNMWDAFFEPLHFDRCPETVTRTDRYADTRMTGIRAYLYMYRDRPRREYHRTFTRYVHLRPSLQQRVNAMYEEQLRGRYCVGVHFRNVRHSVECPRPIPPIAEFIRRTKALIADRADACVFLATDVQEAVEEFRKAFGDRLACQPNVTRSLHDGDDHVHHGAIAPSVQLGEEVVVDCFLLAKCDLLLHVTSNLATAVAYINPDIRLVYCERSAFVGLCGYGVKSVLSFLIWRLPFFRLLSPQTRRAVGMRLAQYRHRARARAAAHRARPQGQRGPA